MKTGFRSQSTLHVNHRRWTSYWQWRWFEIALKSPIQPRVKLLSCSQLPLLQQVTVQLGGNEEKLTMWLTNDILGLDEICHKLHFILLDANINGERVFQPPRLSPISLSLSLSLSTLSLPHPVNPFIEPVMHVCVGFVFLCTLSMDFVRTLPLVAFRQVPTAS